MNYFSLSKAQVMALSRWLDETMPRSLDKLVEKVGTDDAFRLAKMKERLAAKAAEASTDS